MNKLSKVLGTLLVASGLVVHGQVVSLPAPSLSGISALPNGVTGTTQTAGDNTTKIATDAFVLANSGSGTTSMVNVKSTGTVKGDGSTNDTSALQTFITANSTATIFFPPGNYVLGNTTTSTPGLTLGTGGATFSGTLFFAPGAQLTCNTASTSSGNCLYLNGLTSGSFYNMTVTYTSAVIGNLPLTRTSSTNQNTLVQNSSNLVFVNTHFVGGSGPCLWDTGTSNNTYIQTFVSNCTADGFHLQNSGNWYGRGLLSSNAGDDGFAVTETANATISSWSITSNVVTFQTSTQSPALTNGQVVLLAGFPTSTFFNNQTVTVSATGLTTTQFEAPFTHANASATEAGNVGDTHAGGFFEDINSFSGHSRGIANVGGRNILIRNYAVSGTAYSCVAALGATSGFMPSSHVQISHGICTNIGLATAAAGTAGNIYAFDGSASPNYITLDNMDYYSPCASSCGTNPATNGIVLSGSHITTASNTINGTPSSGYSMSGATDHLNSSLDVTQSTLGSGFNLSQCTHCYFANDRDDTDGGYGLLTAGLNDAQFTNFTIRNSAGTNSHLAASFQTGSGPVVVNGLNILDDQATSTGYVIGDYNNGSFPLTISGISSAITNATFSIVALNGTTTNAIYRLARPIASASLGGSSLAAGACSSNTVTVPGATTLQSVSVAPVTYPGDGYYWKGYVSATGTVTEKVCAAVAGTPTASVYNVTVQ